MKKDNLIQPEHTTVQFAVVVNNGVISKIGKSFIMMPKPKHTGGGIKWFDDTKLIRGGGAV